MRKYKVLLSVLSLSGLIFGVIGYHLYFKHRQEDYFFKCESDMLYDVYDGDTKTTLDALYVLALGNNNQGFLHITGVVKKNGSKEDIDRTYYVNYQRNKNIGVYKVKVNREKISVYDTVDSTLFHANFLPDKPGEDIYVRASNPEQNIFLIEGFSYPYFMCTANQD